VRRLALILAVAGVLLAPATPAFAHGGDAPEATAYRTTVTGITPPMRGLSVRTVEAGARLELTNDSGRTVEVLGYAGEPYLEVRPDGTYQNVHSPAAYLNATLAGDGPVPVSADPTAPPSWRRVSGSTTVRWHDRRTHWLDAAPANLSGLSGTQRLRDWAVPLRDQTKVFEIRGTLDWVPPPVAAWWWAGAALLGVAVFALAARWRQAVRAVALIAGTTVLGYAVLRTVDGMPLSPVLIVVGVAAAAAGVFAFGPFLSALAGGLLAVFAGLVNAGVFRTAVAPAAGPAWLSRVAVLVAIGAGAGMVAAAAVRLRASPIPRSWSCGWSKSAPNRQKGNHNSKIAE
jgi:hypothetical protein